MLNKAIRKVLDCKNEIAELEKQPHQWPKEIATNLSKIAPKAWPPAACCSPAGFGFTL